ncbi:hypothetical protein BZM27_23055 [Paraburkholderia steynii]|uniref:Uncharacterized protein n=1 Tax=Paraburkholderia steynii TaxID=1245441 RepID=A0A4V2NH03_9BURK|nr:hypothetical protein BZM27_23055 [Paraburkholderia steynii]
MILRALCRVFKTIETILLHQVKLQSQFEILESTRAEKSHPRIGHAACYSVNAVPRRQIA